MALDVAGAGSDARHPFIVRDCKAWNVHWAMHSHSSFMMIDVLTVHASEYGLWRMNYANSAVRGVKFDTIEVQPDFAPYKGTRPEESQFPKPLDPVDDFAPITIITHTSQQKDGAWLVRGTTSDNGEVKRVVVNGSEAHATRANFAEWEATIKATPSGKTELKAFAEDAAGNIETKPHVVALVNHLLKHHHHEISTPLFLPAHRAARPHAPRRNYSGEGGRMGDDARLPALPLRGANRPHHL